MNICFLLGHLTANGGIGRVTSMIVNQLVCRPNVHCCILSYYNTGKPLFYQIDPRVQLGYLMQNYSSMAKYMLCQGHKNLAGYLKEKKIDILIACGALFFPISVLASKKAHTRCICWEHTAPELNSDYKGQALARRFGIKRSDFNVVLTKRSLNTYINKFKCRNTVQIYNPIDRKVLDCAGTYSNESKRIISVGRLSFPKNFGLAIEVADKVLKQHADWNWDIYGEGEEREHLEEKIRALHLEGKVNLRGQADNLYELYQKYSFMVMTSRYEGFPMSLLEGMGNSLPLVSFDIDTGPDEIIQDGINGFLLQPGDRDGMIRRIEELITNDALRKRFSAASNEKAKQFSIDTIIDEWINLFNIMI